MTTFRLAEAVELEAAFTVIQELKAQHQTDKLPFHEYFHALKKHRVDSFAASTYYRFLGCYLDGKTLNTTKIFDHAISNALNPSASPKVLIKLSEMRDFHVMLALARNPNTPPEALAQLCSTLETEINCAVASHANTSLETLEHLAGNGYFEVREKVALNQNTSADLLIRSLEESGATGLGLNSSANRSIAENPDTPVEVLTHIAHMKEDRAIHIKELVIRNPSLPVEVLEEMMMDINGNIRRFAREHRVEVAMNTEEYAGYPREWVEQIILQQLSEEITVEGS